MTSDTQTPHEVDFQHIPTGGFFGECVQPTRAAAEQYAIDKLIGLGEERFESEQAARFAGYTAADARTYAVRIYPSRTTSPS
ncbi:hypothetical protein [Rhodococcus sp. RDE2]|uniref:hypothetical protein n=1 Tax=Rhodococcus sp. RDE2 TaxID=2885078 RepID=UPI001E4634A6|nr:hypothetical protein [Rhodococcus sp. RDE2]BDB63537.1 hypothetical protein RDE2_53310 [Rhodococcus sp. RDE2]